MPTHHLRGLLLGVALAASVVACGGAAATAVPVATAPTNTTPTSTSGGAIVRVSANSATAEELTAALQAAGVPNADRWTREVMEYRPYDMTDTTLTKLQDNLAKYNPSPETLQAILRALQP